MTTEHQTPELKEWVRVSRTPKATTVTVTVMRGPVTTRWTTPAYPTQLREGVATARAGALAALQDIEAALAVPVEAAA